MDTPSARTLFERHHAVVYRFLRRMTGDPAAADDLVQDVFVRVMRGLEHYEARERDLAWLFRIARRLVLDRQRSSRQGPVLVQPVPDNTPARASVPHLRLSLDQALGTLSEVEREAFLLREVAGLGYEEIAAVTGGTRDAVRNRIHRARLSLRTALAAHSLTSRAQPPRDATS